MKVDYRRHVVLYALIIIPTLVLIACSSSIFADVVPDGGDGKGVYTETWTVSTTPTTNSSATNTARQVIAITVDGEDIVISVVIGTTSVIIGRMSSSLSRRKRESDSIILASDLDAFTPEMKNELLKNIKEAIDQKRKDREIDAETLKQRLKEFDKLKSSPHFDDAIERLRNMREELTFDNLQEQVETLEEKSKELKDLRQCRKCDQPVQATPFKGGMDFVVQWYRHQDPSSVMGYHTWCVDRDKDVNAFEHWRAQRNLPTKQTHCKCAYCGTMHRRNGMKYSNSFLQRWFGYGPKFKCQNPKCGKEQWVPKTDRWEDETVSIFIR